MKRRSGVLCRCAMGAVLGFAAFSTITRAGEIEAPASAPQFLPDGTVLYAEIAPWKNWSADFSKTSLAKIAGDPDVRAFLAGPFTHFSKMLRGGAEQAPEWTVKTENMAASFFSIMDQFAPGPFTVALRYSGEDQLAGRQPAWAVVAGIGDEKNIEEKNNNVLSLLDSILRDTKIDSVSVSEYQGGKLLTVKLPEGKTSITVVVHKNRAIASNDLSFTKQILDGMAGTLTHKLADASLFKNTGLDGSEHFGAYLGLTGMQKAMGVMEKENKTAGGVGEFFALAGLDKADTVAWSMKMSGPAFESRTAILSTHDRAGLLGALSDEPLSDEALKMIPAATPFATGFHVKKDHLLPLIRTAFKATQGAKGAEQFDEVAAQLRTEGHDLERELPGAFGGEVVLTSLSGTEIMGASNLVPAFAASLSVSDPQKAEALLILILQKMAAKMDAAGNASNVLKSVEGSKIRYLTPASTAGALGITPAFTIQENRLIMAVDVPSLKKAMRLARDGGGLAGSERFKASLDGVGGKMGSMFTYVDYGFIYRTTASLATTAVRIIGQNDLLKAVGVDINLLPDSDVMAQHLFPAMSVARVTPAGVVLSSRSPLPSVEVLTPPMAAISALYASFGFKRKE